MTLASALSAQQDQTAKMAPAEVLDVLDNGVAMIADSGIAGSAINVGDRAPAFSLPDATGSMVSLDELREVGPVVVSFYRGGWCPYCNLELRALQSALPEIRAAGATLVAISPQAPDESLSTQEKAELSYPVLSDAGSDVIGRYGLIYTVDDATRNVLAGFGNDLARINGTDMWELPIPATYVIGTDGVVTYAFVDPDYRHRAEPADVVAAAQATR